LVRRAERAREREAAYDILKPAIRSAIPVQSASARLKASRTAICFAARIGSRRRWIVTDAK
jgi:hypothetical protein